MKNSFVRKKFYITTLINSVMYKANEKYRALLINLWNLCQVSQTKFNVNIIAP